MVADILRNASAGSAVVRLARLGLQRKRQAPRKPVATAGDPREETAVLDVVAESRVLAPLRAAAARAAAAWPASRTRQRLATLGQVAAAMTIEERIRAAGVFVLAAAGSDALAGLFNPRPASAYRWGLRLVVIAAGAATSAAAGRVAAAWKSRRA